MTSPYRNPRTTSTASAGKASLTGALLLLVLQATLVACGGAEATRPALTLEGASNPSTLKVGETLSLKVSLQAEGEIQSLDVTRKVESDEKSLQSLTSSFQSATAHTFDFSYEVENFPGKSIVLTFKATDKQGGTASKEYTFIPQRSTALREWKGITLGGPSHSTTGNFFSSTTGEVFTKAQASTNVAKIDVVYMAYSSLSYFVSPSKVGEEEGFESIPGATLTEYQYASSTFTAAQFDAMGDDTAIANLDIQESEDAFTNGSIMLFKTADGRKGIIKITGRTSGAAGSITMDVKVQKYPAR
ncbi:hypothetical protein [Archangium sp.]|jgi:hypothetical protein|uniref:hypothetical protein n=1 Tax=Archangium sp. TaxID=1872627 RepID=UPI002ED8B5D7